MVLLFKLPSRMLVSSWRRRLGGERERERERGRSREGRREEGGSLCLLGRGLLRRRLLRGRLLAGGGLDGFGHGLWCLGLGDATGLGLAEDDGGLLFNSGGLRNVSMLVEVCVVVDSTYSSGRCGLACLASVRRRLALCRCLLCRCLLRSSLGGSLLRSGCLLRRSLGGGSGLLHCGRLLGRSRLRGSRLRGGGLVTSLRGCSKLYGSGGT